MIRTLPEGNVKFVVVHKQLVAQREPMPLRIHYRGCSIPAKIVTFDGQCVLRYSDPNSHAGGARAYIETRGSLTYEDGDSGD